MLFAVVVGYAGLRVFETTARVANSHCHSEGGADSRQCIVVLKKPAESGFAQFLFGHGTSLVGNAVRCSASVTYAGRNSLPQQGGIATREVRDCCVICRMHSQSCGLSDVFVSKSIDLIGSSNLATPPVAATLIELLRI